MRILYFEDFAVGDQAWGAEVVVDREEMLEYARRNDPWPFHIDEEAAAATPFGGLIASAGYSISLLYRSIRPLWNGPEQKWALQGAVDWCVRFHQPIRPGQRMREKLTILETRRSSKSSRGFVKARQEFFNQDHELALTLDFTFVVATRPETTPA